MTDGDGGRKGEVIPALGVGQWRFSLEYIKICVWDIQAELFENSRKAQILISPEGGLRFLPASSLLTSLSPCHRPWS